MPWLMNKGVCQFWERGTGVSWQLHWPQIAAVACAEAARLGVCICMYIYTDIYIYTHTYISVSIYIYYVCTTHVDKCVCVCVILHTYTHIFLATTIHTRIALACSDIVTLTKP